MKFSSMRAFQKHLDGSEKAGFSDLYLVTSSEGSGNKIATDRLIQAIQRRENIDSLGVQHLQCPKAKELDQEINTLNFFTPKRILVISDADDLNKEAEELLLKTLPSHLFVILQGKLGTGAFYKKIEKKGIVVELGGEKSWEKEKNAQEWIVERMQEEKKKIDSVAVQLLARETGGEIALLEQEIEKLVLYTHGRPSVTKEDVFKLCISKPTYTLFQLSEALFKRDPITSIRVFRALLEEGTSYFALLKQLRSQVLTDLEIASILKNGGNVTDITKAYPYIKGFILEKHMETVRSWGFEGLKRLFVLLDDFEIRAKEGTCDYELMGDLLILKAVS